MDSATIDKIKVLVHQALADQDLKGKSKQKSSNSGSKVLVIFHSAVYRLDETLNQIKRIEKMSKRLSVYRGESALSSININEVREKSGARCVVDKAGSSDLEKILDLSDIIILPTFCCATAAKVANLCCDDFDSRLVFSALMKGKKILAARDGFSKPDISINSFLKEEIDKIFDKLKRFGMICCSTDKLSSIFQELVLQEKDKKRVILQNENNGAMKIKLITAKDVNTAVENNQKNIKLAFNGKVTPLARDLAKEYAIEILNCDEQEKETDKCPN